MKLNFPNSLSLIINGFLFFFFMLYVGEFGLSNLIIQETTKWDTIFNIGIWYIMLMYCYDKFFEILNQLKLKGGKKKWKKKKH